MVRIICASAFVVLFSFASRSEQLELSSERIARLLSKDPAYSSDVAAIGLDTFVQDFQLNAVDLDKDGHNEMVVRVNNSALYPAPDGCRGPAWRPYSVLAERESNETVITLRRLGDSFGCVFLVVGPDESPKGEHRDVFAMDTRSRFRLLRYRGGRYEDVERHTTVETNGNFDTIVSSIDERGYETSSTRQDGLSRYIEKFKELQQGDGGSEIGLPTSQSSMTVTGSPCSVQIAGDGNHVNLSCEIGIAFAQIEAVVAACSVPLRVAVHPAPSKTKSTGNKFKEPSLDGAKGDYAITLDRAGVDRTALETYEKCLDRLLRTITGKEIELVSDARIIRGSFAIVDATRSLTAEDVESESFHKKHFEGVDEHALDWKFNDTFFLAVGNPEVSDVRDVRVFMVFDLESSASIESLTIHPSSCKIERPTSSTIVMIQVSCAKLAPGEVAEAEVQTRHGRIESVDVRLRSESFSEQKVLTISTESE